MQKFRVIAIVTIAIAVAIVFYYTHITTIVQAMVTAATVIAGIYYAQEAYKSYKSSDFEIHRLAKKQAKELLFEAFTCKFTDDRIKYKSSNKSFSKQELLVIDYLEKSGWVTELSIEVENDLKKKAQFLCHMSFDFHFVKSVTNKDKLLTKNKKKNEFKELSSDLSKDVSKHTDARKDI